MKRVEETTIVYLPPVRFYLEDLEYVLQVLSKDMDVDIQYQNFSYESLADLKANIQRDSIDSLILSASQRAPQYAYLSIHIKPEEVTLFADANTSERRAHVAELLRSKVRWYSWKPNEPWWHGLQGALALIVPAMVAVTTVVALPLPPVAAIVVSGLVFVLGTLLLFSNRVWLGGSRIFLYSSFGKPTFWQRNRDTILVSAITSSITAAIGFVAGYLSK
jgi:hypothetical protein